MPKNHVELRFKRTSIISILVVNEFLDLSITSKSSHAAPSSLSSSPNTVVVKKNVDFLKEKKTPEKQCCFACC